MDLRCCTTRRLHPGLAGYAAEAAIRENAGNHPLGLAALAGPEREKAALVTSSQWAPGKTLRVRFVGGSKADRDEVVTAMGEWSQYAAVTFAVVGQGDAEIRVAFVQGGGSWSYIGTDALMVPANEPTMNIGWTNDYARSLHEVGHSLGLIHEHQNPLAKIPWNIPAVLAYYQGPPNSWPSDEIIRQVISPETRPLTNGGYDRNSIMEYPIPVELVTDPGFAVGWNQKLSPGDKDFIARMYPGRYMPTGPATPPTTPGEPGTPSGPTGAEGRAKIKLHVPAAGDYELNLSLTKVGG